jgi:hypothetical protein
MIKARIKKNGFLLIKRCGIEYKDQLCCRQAQTETNVVKCGDWCPCFGEIEEVRDKRNIISHKLTLCSGVIIGRVTDNREAAE